EKILLGVRRPSVDHDRDGGAAPRLHADRERVEGLSGLGLLGDGTPRESHHRQHDENRNETGFHSLLLPLPRCTIRRSRDPEKTAVGEQVHCPWVQRGGCFRPAAVPCRSALAQNPGGRSPATPDAFSRAIATAPIVPSSKRRPISETPCGTRRGVENFGIGFFGSGAQSLRASVTCRKPVRSTIAGWPVKLVIVRASSRSGGDRSTSIFAKRRAISAATLRRIRSAWTKSTAERKRACRKRFGHASGTCILSWSMPCERVSSSKAAAPSAKSTLFRELN